MKSILFVCLGNICRSPSAEYIFKDIIKKADLADDFHVESRATYSGNNGMGVYAPAARVLSRHNIDCSGHRARTIQRSDYDKFDHIIGMDSGNYSDLLYLFKDDRDGKISKLLDFTDSPRDIADPYYTGDYETAFNDIYSGCRALYEALTI